MVSTSSTELISLSMSVESEPPFLGGPLPDLEAGKPVSSSLWNVRVEQAQLRFDLALGKYRTELAAALAVDESQINVSAYPTLKIQVGDALEDLPLGEELFLDLFTLYVAGGWRQVDVATAVVSSWSGVELSNLKPREATLPGGVDTKQGVPRAATRFYRECRLLLAEFVMQGIRDAESRLLGDVRARLDAALDSVTDAIRTFGIHHEVVVDHVGGGFGTRVVPRMAEPTLSTAVHGYLVQVGMARQQIESINARLAVLRNGAQIGRPQLGGIGSGASHGGFGGSDAPQSEAELLAELAKQTQQLVEAGRQLQLNAPWAMVIAAQMTGSTSEESMLVLLDTALAEVKDTVTTIRGALNHEGVLDRYLGPDAEAMVALAYPKGPEAVLVERAIEDVGEGDYEAVHLLCERSLLDLYEDETSSEGIRSVVLGRMIAELLKVYADREAAFRVRQDARQKANQVNAVLGLLVFIPIGGQVGAAIRAISEFSDMAMMLSAATAYSEQYDDVRRQTAIRLADEGHGDIAMLGELLAMRRNLLQEIALEVLTLMVFRAAGRVRRLKQLIFVRGAIQDVDTLLELIQADEVAGQ